MPSIRVFGRPEVFECNLTTSVLNVLLRNRFPIHTVCGGRALCGRDLIRIREGAQFFSPRREMETRRLAELAHAVKIDGRPAWEQEWVRQRLAEFMTECEALKYTRLRSLTRRLKGLQPGPEGSVLKLAGSELGVAIARFASELLGQHALLGAPTGDVPDAPRWLNRVLSSRQYTIAGGTSEIQRNIIGERTLGLPKE